MVTWTKLRTGDWGLRGTGLTPGVTVTVIKRSGEAKPATVGRILWTGADGTQIATVAPPPGPSTVARREPTRYAEDEARLAAQEADRAHLASLTDDEAIYELDARYSARYE